MSHSTPSMFDLVAAAKKEIDEVSVVETKEAIDCACFADSASSGEPIMVIDVREPAELEDGKVPSAINIPRGRLEFDIWNEPPLNQYDRESAEDLAAIVETPIYLYCRSGGRSALAAQTLQNMGFKNVHSMAGGFLAWQAADHPIEQ